MLFAGTFRENPRSFGAILLRHRLDLIGQGGQVNLFPRLREDKLHWLHIDLALHVIEFQRWIVEPTAGCIDFAHGLPFLQLCLWAGFVKIDCFLYRVIPQLPAGFGEQHNDVIAELLAQLEVDGADVARMGFGVLFHNLLPGDVALIWLPELADVGLEQGVQRHQLDAVHLQQVAVLLGDLQVGDGVERHLDERLADVHDCLFHTLFLLVQAVPQLLHLADVLRQQVVVLHVDGDQGQALPEDVLHEHLAVAGAGEHPLYDFLPLLNGRRRKRLADDGGKVVDVVRIEVSHLLCGRNQFVYFFAVPGLQAVEQLIADALLLLVVHLGNLFALLFAVLPIFQLLEQLGDGEHKINLCLFHRCIPPILLLRR
nr:MAG TPA: hypothetical protein [Caudoviricetes sp.]